MKGYKFYLEYPDSKSKRKATRKNLGKHSGNCVATWNSWFLSETDWNVDAITSIQDYSNCPVCCTSVSFCYLREKCKRISEQQAREIHPKLFNYLD
jgi:hypothetical protein